jgi:hypothetical protein
MSVSLLLHEELSMVAVSEDWNIEVFSTVLQIYSTRQADDALE